MHHHVQPVLLGRSLCIYQPRAWSDLCLWPMQYFPIIAEDYENTIDRPDCENRPDNPLFQEQGSLLHCNTRLRNLTRLDHVVKGALRKCAPC